MHFSPYPHHIVIKDSPCQHRIDVRDQVLKEASWLKEDLDTLRKDTVPTGRHFRVQGQDVFFYILKKNIPIYIYI